MSVTAKAGFKASVTEILTYAMPPQQLNPPADSPAPTVDNLIESCRLKVQATLPEVLHIVESLDSAPDLTEGNLPFVVLDADEPTDVSGNWQVKAVAQSIVVNFVYVAKNAGDGATDDAQTLRARQEVLRQGFYADYHLGGIVTKLETQAVSSQKQNQYEQFFASKGTAATVMILSLQFTLVQRIA